jgi:hypothetical protein
MKDRECGKFGNTTRGLCGALLIGAAAGVVSPLQVADAATAGPTFEILNVTDTDYPLEVQRVVRDASGDFVVLWRTLGGQPGSPYFVRAYTATGTPKGPAAVMSGLSGNVAIAMADTGAFVVAWNEPNPSVTPLRPQDRIFVQRYAPDGTAQGDPIAVARIPSAWTQAAAFMSVGLHVAADANGDFAVAWTTVYQHVVIIPGSIFPHALAESSSYIKVYDPTGKARTIKVLVDAQGPRLDRYRYVGGLAMNASGHILVALNSHAERSTIRVKSYELNGRPSRGFSFTPIDVGILDSSPDLFGIPGVELGEDAAGNFVLAWSETVESTSIVDTSTVAGYSADGAERWRMTAAPELRLSVEPSGDFALAWPEQDPVVLDYTNHGQYYHADGSANGASFQFADQGQNWTRDLSIATDAAGGIVAVWGVWEWSDGSDPQAPGFASSSIVGQFYSP